MALSLRRNDEPIAPAADDYLVEGDEQPNRPSTAAQIVHFLQLILIVVLAVLSLSVFWLVGLLLNIF